MVYASFVYLGIAYPRQSILIIHDSMAGQCDFFLPQVTTSLSTFAMNNLKKFFDGIATRSLEIAGKETYEEIYEAIVSFSWPTKEVQFHAKNMANTLELKLVESWMKTPESLKNGLGPGFRCMCHVMQGEGKYGQSLSMEEMEGMLAQSTEKIQAVWPWESQLRQRHVQSVYCEAQKVLCMARQGCVLGTISRAHSQITQESLQKIASRQKLFEKKHAVELTSLSWATILAISDIL